MGVVGSFSAEDNAILGYHGRPEFNGGGLPAARARSGRTASGKMAAYDVRPPSPRLRITAFSGGNQQKLVLAREIDSNPSVLIVGQPTRGVDIGAIEFIHRRLVELRDAGKAVLVVSVELDEIIGLVGPDPRHGGRRDRGRGPGRGGDRGDARPHDGRR